MHDRVADEHAVEDVVRLDSGFRADLADQDADRFAHRLGHGFASVRVHHHVGDPAHQILAEADLRVGSAGGGKRAPGEQRGEVAGDGGGADIDGDAAGEIVQARPERDHLCPGRAEIHRGRHLPVPVAQNALQLGQQAKIDARRFDLPLLGERAQEPVGVAERFVHVGLFHLHVAELGRGIAFDGAGLGALPNDLAVDLHVLRPVDAELQGDDGGAEDLQRLFQRRRIEGEGAGVVAALVGRPFRAEPDVAELAAG